MSRPSKWPNFPKAAVAQHRFRSRILGLMVAGDRLIATTEQGVYRLDKNGKRWRKVPPAQEAA